MKTLKIKLEKSPQLETYLTELKRWEKEGGNPASLDDLKKYLSLPLEKGNTFEVVSGSIQSEGDTFYYAVDVKLLSDEEEAD